MAQTMRRWWDWPQAHLKLSPSIFAIKEWRQQEHDAGRRSGLNDYFSTHGYCFDCKATGIRVSPAGWEGDVPLFEQCGVCNGTARVETTRRSEDVGL
jgi:hypothetical protein